ncbi:MAG: penicillin-binding protein 1A [Alphaproteobacteria bacterium]|nr:penicillin-binding protein 1A [Alphaproteobacteria bacterium]
MFKFLKEMLKREEKSENAMARMVSTLFSYALLMVILGLIVCLLIFSHFGRSVPDYRQLALYEPPITSRLYASDGHLLAEYATEKRAFVPYETIPEILVKSFISAEDKKFFSHGGVDFVGIIRAVFQNLRYAGKGRRMIGASTITQQVAKNFLLTNEESFERKIKEAILAVRIERAFSKEYIMELYLNQIYLGHYSYGVAAAALNYFNKSLDELTISECAFLAALPKGPNNYDPDKKYDEAIKRRNWVLSRMLEDEAITEEQYKAEIEQPITVVKRSSSEKVEEGEYFAEEVRRLLVSKYGEDALYKGGLAVMTTVDPEMQKFASIALRNGLIEYDRRHGYRGAFANIDIDAIPDVVQDKEEPKKEDAKDEDSDDEEVAENEEVVEEKVPNEKWVAPLEEIKAPVYIPKNWRVALVLNVQKEEVEIGFTDNTTGKIPLAELKWARKDITSDQTLGPEIRNAKDVLKRGDVIFVSLVKKDAKGEDYPENTYALNQIPAVEGAMVVLNPHTGRVLSMVGGYSFKKSQFNRATQAKRQPGSSFKPFIYLAALDEGFTPSSLVLDAPFVMDQGPGLGKWKPKNFSNRFHGPTTLRVGIEKSMNLITVRVARAIGIGKVVEYAKKFGISEDLPHQMSVALGSGETTVLNLANAYGMLVNGGKKISPILIDRITDRTGMTVYNSDSRPCPNCRYIKYKSSKSPKIQDIREQIEDPRSAYQIINILTGVLQPGGSASNLRRLGRTYAGKTGTSNNSLDGWFVGVTPDLVVAIFIGFDEPRTLGQHDTGGTIASPIFKHFVDLALKNEALIPFRVPNGIRLARVNHKTGRPAQGSDKDVVLEAFKSGEDWQGKLKGGYIDGTEGTDIFVSDASTEDSIEQGISVHQTTESFEDNVPDIGTIF